MTKVRAACGAVVVVVAAGALGGCSTDRKLPGEATPTTAAPGDGGSSATTATTARQAAPATAGGVDLADIDWANVDVPPKLLSPPVIGNANVRLTQEAGRTASFCQGWGLRFELEEAAPYDLRAQTAYANSYYYTIRSINPTGRIPNKQRKPGQPDSIEVPAEVRGALATVEKEMYAFYARMTFTDILLKNKTINAEQVRRRIDYAFVHLGAASFTDAHEVLEKFYAEKC